MYNLHQAGLLANKLLKKCLNKHGYQQSRLVPGLWKHNTKPIQFTLVVNDFGIKYVGKEHAQHLKNALKEHCKLTSTWTGKQYIGITLDWNYNKCHVHLSMPNYVQKALKQFKHKVANYSMRHTKVHQYNMAQRNNTQHKNQRHHYKTTKPSGSSNRYAASSYSLVEQLIAPFFAQSAP